MRALLTMLTLWVLLALVGLSWRAQTPTETPTPTPSPTATYPAEIDPLGITSTVIERLQKLGIVPEGGRSLFTVETGYGKTSDPGYSLISIGKGARARNFVLGATVSWNQIGLNSGCGVLFRSDSQTNNSVILFNQDRSITVVHYEGDRVQLRYQSPVDRFDPDKVTLLTLIALDDRLLVYLNGALETALQTPGTVVRGSFSLAVYNARENTVVTDCRFRNVWIWSFDSKEQAIFGNKWAVKSWLNPRTSAKLQAEQ